LAHCIGTTKSGDPCRSTSIGASGYCAYHDGKSPLGTAAGARAAALRSAEVRAAKAEERSKTLRDLLHDRLEEHAEEIVQCFLASAREGDWRAADALITRVYGKPQDRLEVSKPGQPFDFSQWSLEEIQAFKARLIEDYPELAHYGGRQG
jgi:hypothetical protein